MTGEERLRSVGNHRGRSEDYTPILWVGGIDCVPVTWPGKQSTEDEQVERSLQ